MSERLSLYISIQIDQKALSDFLEQPCRPPTLDEQWTKWWDTRQMASKQLLDPAHHGFKGSGRALLDQILQDKYAFGQEHYNDERSLYTFLSVFYTENFLELLPLLCLLKNLGTHQGPRQRGFALIYDYYWGSEEVMAFMEFNQGVAQLFTYECIGEIPAALLDEATRSLTAAMEAYMRTKNE